MTQAKSGDIVKLQYTGRLDDNSVFETSVDRDIPNRVAPLFS